MIDFFIWYSKILLIVSWWDRAFKGLTKGGIMELQHKVSAFLGKLSWQRYFWFVFIVAFLIFFPCALWAWDWAFSPSRGLTILAATYEAAIGACGVGVQMTLNDDRRFCQNNG